MSYGTDEDRLLSLTEIARMLGLHRNTIWNAAKEDRLPFPLVVIRHRKLARLGDVRKVIEGRGA